MPSTDPFSGTLAPVSGEKMAINVARSGAARSGATRSGFLGNLDGTFDVRDKIVPGSTAGPDYALRDRSE